MKQPLVQHARSWFAVTDTERRVLAAVLALFLFGLWARHRALRREQAVATNVSGWEHTEDPRP